MKTLVSLLLLAGLAFPDGKPEEKPPEKKKVGAEIEIPDPGTAIEDPAVAKQEVARFDKEMDAAKGIPEEVAAIERLAGFDHVEVLKALNKLVKDKDREIAVAAICGVARQSKSKEAAGKALLAILKNEKRTEVICAAVVGMGRLGYDHKAAIAEATKLFQKDTREPHKAATRYFGFIKFKPAFRMLAEKLDEPRPIAENQNNPGANPPASYWKERWEEWNSNVPFTRWALAQLVEGETFEKAVEAKQWAESEGKKHGIEW